MNDNNVTRGFARGLGFKFLHLYLPLIGLAAGLALLYSAFNWYLVAGSGILPLDSDVANYWLPVGLALIMTYLLMHKRIALLDLNEKRATPFLVLALAMAAVVIPLLIAQSYVGDAAGTLTPVADATRIATAPQSRFYAAHDLCFMRAGTQAQGVLTPSGHNDETLDFDIYAAVPVCDAQQPDHASRTVWIGLLYHKSVSNSLSDADKDKAYKAFADESQNALNSDDPRRYSFLERVRAGQKLRNLQKALKNGGLDPDGAIFLLPHTGSFEARTGGGLGWALGALEVAAIAWFFLILILPLRSGPVEMPAPEPARVVLPFANDEGAGNFFLPTRANWGLPLLLDINIGVYLAMVLAGLGVIAFQTDDLLAWGATFGPAIHGLGVLRLLTATFVHAGLMHLAGNMYGLVIIGMFLRPVAVNARLVLLYLLCGLGGSLASISVHPATVGVGASGAIFGMAGVLLVLLALNDWRVREIRRFALINIGIFVVYNLAVGAASSGIDNAAHVGGLATGAVLGLALFVLGRRSAP